MALEDQFLKWSTRLLSPVYLSLWQGQALLRYRPLLPCGITGLKMIANLDFKANSSDF